MSTTGKDLEILHELKKVIFGLETPEEMEIHERVNSLKLLFLVVVS